MKAMSISKQPGQSGGLAKKEKSFFRIAYEQRQLLVLSVPFLLFVLVFNYFPIWGWITAFQQYRPAKGVFGSSFVGLDNFKELFQDANFINSVVNTLSISVVKIALGFASALILAVMLNEVRNVFFKRFVQTISYLPYFVSWVVATSIVYMALSPTDGIINVALMKLGIIKEAIPFMGKPNYFVGIIGFSNIWKNVGWNAIIYLAAMTGIDPELYEAAAIDGAGRINRIMAVTIPCIMPTVKIMLVLAIGTLMNAGFEHVYLLSNPSNISASRTIDVYVFNYALKTGRMSYGTAIGMFNSTISITLILVCNWISKRIDGYGIF